METIVITAVVVEVINIAAFGAAYFYRKKIKAGVQTVVADVKAGA
ncbi:hypothetical protein [Gluconobacter cadivus]|nr:hypothetical protein [Gluconobacter cadivus]